MKKSTLLIALIFVVLGSCEKGPINGGRSGYDVAYLKHNTFVTSNIKSGIRELAAPSITMNGVTQTEIQGRVFCYQQSYEMIAGQTSPAGLVIISNDQENLLVTYQAENGWKIKQIHLYAGTLALLPVNSQNVPVPGLFPISESFNPAVETVTYQIPLDQLEECFYIAAHAVVVKDGQEETAWGKGDESFEEKLGVNRWGWLIDVCPQECEGEQVVIAVKTYVVDPAKCTDPTCEHEWWAVSGGNLSSSYCFGVGPYTYEYNPVDLSPEEEIYPIFKNGNSLFPAGTVKVSKQIADSKVVGLNVTIGIDDKTLRLSKSFLYVGTLEGFDDGLYNHLELNKECPNWYLWPLYKQEILETHTFYIPF